MIINEFRLVRIQVSTKLGLEPDNQNPGLISLPGSDSSFNETRFRTINNKTVQK